MDNPFSIDEHVFAGIDGKEYSGDDDDSVSICAYMAGRRMSGLPNVYPSEAIIGIGCAATVDSLHPANFRADA